jgi:thioredoxin reductase
MHYDAIIIGGSFAGLSAAIYLARARRTVCVIDADQPRNRFAEHAHGFLTQDGNTPDAMLATARAQVAVYPTVTFIKGKAITAHKHANILSVVTDEGVELTCTKLLLAFGISDILPEIAGIEPYWGSSVLHCPYCHGYEYSDRKLGVLYSVPVSLHQAMIVSQWGPTVLYLNGHAMTDGISLAHMKQHNIMLEPATIDAVSGDGKNLSHIHFHNGRTNPVDALYLAPRNMLNSPVAAQLGCQMAEDAQGVNIVVDTMQMTNVEGVYAAGDITRRAHNITFASADGVMAGMAIHRALVFDTSAQGVAA